MDANPEPANTIPPPSQPANDGQERRKTVKCTTRNLALRAFSALGILAVTYGCLRWDVIHASGWAFAALMAVLSVLCLREFYRLAMGSGSQPFSLLGYVAGPFWIIAMEWDLAGGAKFLVGMSAPWCMFIVACVVAMLLQLTRKTNDSALNNVSLTLFGIIYCCILPGLNLHLRHLQLGPGGWPMHGVEFVVTCVFITKVSDVGALLVGSRWGKTKLIPRLSPGKTREGAIGGLLFSVFLLQLMTWTSPWMALNSLGKLHLLLLSVLLAAAGLAGDLIESAFKRNSHKKDAGTGIPGFGGMLDLTDSLMIATPIMYFFLVLCGAEYIKS